MRWPERQQAMLREMGIRLWLPPAQAAEARAAAEAAVPAAESAAAARPPGAVPRAVPAASPAFPPVSAAPSAHAPPPAAAVASVAAAAPSSAGTTAPARGPAPPAAARGAVVELGPRPVGVEQMDWAALRAAVAGCTACGLCRGRTNTVFGVGHESAHWMLVGEAPGQQEDQQGEPFVGKAGQLLDNMLRSVGLTRADAPPEQQVFIANVLKCRPPGNRNPEPPEVAQCEPFLKRQVALVRPKMILAMGRFAVQSLLQTQDAIGRLRGRVHRYEGVPLVVTYHPAYLLRNPLDKARSWEDLCLAREVFERGGQ
jgi:uracil-DNA glycosylase family 4